VFLFRRVNLIDSRSMTPISNSFELLLEGRSWTLINAKRPSPWGSPEDNFLSFIP
jgi:hypothetical protein